MNSSINCASASDYEVTLSSYPTQDPSQVVADVVPKLPAACQNQALNFSGSGEISFVSNSKAMPKCNSRVTFHFGFAAAQCDHSNFDPGKNTISATYIPTGLTQHFSSTEISVTSNYKTVPKSSLASESIDHPRSTDCFLVATFGGGSECANCVVPGLDNEVPPTDPTILPCPAALGLDLANGGTIHVVKNGYTVTNNSIGIRVYFLSVDVCPSTLDAAGQLAMVCPPGGSQTATINTSPSVSAKCLFVTPTWGCGVTTLKPYTPTSVCVTIDFSSGYYVPAKSQPCLTVTYRPGDRGGPRTCGVGDIRNPSGGCSPPCPKGSKGSNGLDPVDCQTGNVFDQNTDFSIPGLGGGLTLTREYNSLSNSIQGPFGYGWSTPYTMTLGWDPTGTTFQVTQENGSVVDFEPSSSGTFSPVSNPNVSLVENSDGTYTFTRLNKETFTFNQAGKITSATTLNNLTTTDNYNSQGQLTSVTDPSGRSISFTYNPQGFISSATDPMGRTFEYAYDSAGDLISATSPSGAVTQYSYDSNHDLTQSIDPDGGVTTNVYSSTSLPSDPPGTYPAISQTDPLGRTTSFSYSGDNYSSQGGTTTITNPNGSIEQETFVDGNLTQDIQNYGTTNPIVSTYTYDELGNVLTQTDPNGGITTSTYDGAGDLLSSKNSLGDTTSSTYNLFQEPTFSTNALGEATTYTYDSQGNLLSTSRQDTTTGLYQTTTNTYDQYGDLLTSTDPNGNTTNYDYDKYGNVTLVVDPMGNVTSYTYNLDGEKTSSIQPNGATTSYEYDNSGNLISTKNPLGFVTTSTYDPMNLLISQTNALGETTSHKYDGDGELVLTTNPDGTTQSYTYDSSGNQTSYSNALGQTTTYLYNGLNELVSSTNGLGQTTTYQYDSAGNETSMTSPDGVVTHNSYNSQNQLTDTTYLDGTTPSAHYTYNASGQQVTMEASNLTEYSYDSLGNLTSETASPLPSASISQITPNEIVDSSYSFSGQSLNFPQNDILNFSWNFGDGSSSQLQNPAHSYANPGSYTVTFTITDAMGLMPESTTSQVTVYPQPSVSIGVVSSQTVALTPISFTASASNYPQGDQLTYSWDFDGSTGTTGQNATYIFAQAGEQLVALTVSDSLGLTPQTTYKLVTITAAPPPDITINPSSPLATQQVNFSASTNDFPSGALLSYYWNFGDGISASGQSVTHTYAQPALYTVNVTITENSTGYNLSGSDSLTVLPAPSATFSVPTGTIFEGQSIDLVASTTGYPTGDTLNYAWSFGDGSIASGASSTYQYSYAGNYTITLVVTDSQAIAPITISHSVIVLVPPCNSAELIMAGQDGTPPSPPSGNGQSAEPGTSFSSPLSTYVYCTNSSGVLYPAPADIPVAFEAFTISPNGPSGVFANGQSSTLVKTNPNGLAISPSFSANLVSGTWTVAAAVANLSTGQVEGFLPFYEINSGCPSDGYEISYLTQGPFASGSGQAAQIGTSFYEPLQARLTLCASGASLPSEISFSAFDESPSLPGGSFVGGTLVNGIDNVSEPLLASGIAVSPQITADSMAGQWPAIAATDPNGDVLPYALTNTVGAPPPILPHIFSISPTAGSTNGFQEITIYGTAFGNASKVSFGQNTSHSFTQDSLAEITAQVPPASQGPVNVTVTTPAGTSLITSLDLYTYIAPPQITSASPEFANSLGGTQVTISGTGFTGAQDVSFCGQPASSYSVSSPTQIVAIAPAHIGGTCAISVTTIGGTSSSNSGDQIIYASIAVNSISPIQGPSSGKTVVNINGFGFSGAIRVLFGTKFAKSFSVVSDNEITAVTPRQKSSSVDVRVETKSLISQVSSQDLFSFIGSPIISSVSPNSGAQGGGTMVTISGTNFVDVTSVDFGKVASPSFSVSSSGEIMAVSPPNKAGKVQIGISALGGSSRKGHLDQFIYLPPPTIDRITPDKGPVTGSIEIEILGHNLGAASKVSFGAVRASSYTVVSNNKIEALLPAGGPGIVSVSVTTPGGTSLATSSSQFEYFALPTISSVTPGFGPPSGGINVVILGSNFSQVISVRFGTKRAKSFSIVSPTQIDAVSPAHEIGRVDITLQTEASKSPISQSDQFSYAKVPTIDSISPSSGVQAGGTSVTIVGSGFLDASSVSFGSIEAKSFSVVSANKIIAIDPPQAPGTIDVRVTTPAGISQISSQDEFTYTGGEQFCVVCLVDPQVPGALSATGNSSISTNGVLTVNSNASNAIFESGSSVINASSVFVEGKVVTTGTARLESSSPTQIGSTVNPFSSWTLSQQLGAMQSLKASSSQSLTASPGIYSSIDVSGNARLTLRPGIYVVTSELSVSNSAKLSGSGVTIYLSCSNYPSPCSTGQDGAGISVSGSGHIDLSDGAFGPDKGFVVMADPSNLSTFITQQASNVSINGIVDVPALDVQCVGNARLDISQGDLVADQAQAAASAQINVSGPPAPSTPLAIVTSISPSSGYTSGGTSVTISGSNFVGASQVHFGTLSASSFSVNSPSEITVIAPPQSAGVVDVTVTTSAGTSAVSSHDQFTYAVAPPLPPPSPSPSQSIPIVTSISPSSGPVSGGTSVTISGSNFVGASQVHFGTLSASSFSVNSPSEITVIAPPQSAGVVDVTVTTSGGTSALASSDQFSYTEPPSPNSSCILCVLDQSTSSALGAVGNSQISSSGPITVNSTSPSAVTVTGSSKITGSSAYLGGGVSTSGTGVFNAPLGPRTNSLADPFASYRLDNQSNIVGALSVSGSQVTTGQPGVYSTISVSGNGELTLSPGIYVVTSGLSVSNSAKLTGSGVTIYLSCSNYPAPCSAGQNGAGISVSGAGQLNLSKGATGPGDGFVIWADPNNASSVSSVQSGQITLTGSVDVGSQSIVASGNATIEISSGDLVCDQSQTSGSAHINVSGFTPTISQVSPNSGSVVGNTTVTISGSGFIGVDKVDFGAISASWFEVVSDSTIIATSPPASVGEVDITVISGGGTSASSPNDQFSYENSSHLKHKDKSKRSLRKIHAGANRSYLQSPPNPKQASPHVTNQTNWQLSFGYDLDGNLTSITYPNGKTVSYSYNKDSLMTSETDWLGNTSTYSYNSELELTSQNNPNSISSLESYNANGDLTQILLQKGSTTLEDLAYSPNQLGLISSTNQSGSLMSPAQTSYSYSPTNELTQSGTSAFSYDSAGNIVSMPGTTLSYNLGDELTSTTGASSTTSFAYDPNGNRISESSSTSATITYRYNANNQLTSISNPTLSASYSYNPAGLRSSATYNGVTSSFVYSPSDQLLVDGENYYIYGPSGTPIEQISESSAVPTYLYSDQLGSVVMEADQSGNVVGTQSYSPYGSLASSTGTDPTPFGFAGGYTDPSGLIYLINRYYDPATGQFISVDPEVNITGQPYAYVSGDPMNTTDPDGTGAYSYYFDLGNLGSATDVASFVHSHCSEVFPIANCADNFTVGQVMHLQESWGWSIFSYTQTFPVEVTAVGSTSFSFEALNGHIEGRGRHITFSFDQKGSCDVKLNVFTSSNGSILTNWPIVRDADFWVAHRTWQQFADNIKADYHG